MKPALRQIIFAGRPGNPALRLLYREPAGMAADFTIAGGSVAVKDPATPSNNYVGNKSWWTQSGTSVKWVRGANGVYASDESTNLHMDYDPTTGWALLVEPAATNLCLQSQDFTTTWVNTNTDEPTTNNTDPAGTTTADEIAATSAADQAFGIYQDFTGLTAGNTTTASVFLKLGTNASLVQLAWDAAGTGLDGLFCNFNLASGVKGTVTAFAAGTATSAVITPAANGFYRCSITGKIAAGIVGRFTISIVDSISEAGFGAANLADNDSIIAWQGQVEAAVASASVVPTSPIPTTTIAVTRAVDNPNKALTFLPDVQATGALIQRVSRAQISTNDTLASVNDGTSNERHVVRGTASATQYLAVDGGVTQATQNGALVAANTFLTYAITWQLNNVNIAVNGAAISADTSATMPTTTALQLLPATAAIRVAFFVLLPRSMTNGELQLKTAA